MTTGRISKSRTFKPLRAICIAASHPAKPPPIIVTKSDLTVAFI